MVATVERTEGGIPSSMYNMAAARAAQEALNAGKPMEEAVKAAAEAKAVDEAGRQPKTEAPDDDDDIEESAKYRDYLLCICQVMHGRFGHLSTERLMKIARLHAGTTGLRGYAQWAADDE